MLTVDKIFACDFLHNINNSTAIAEMGDRGHSRHGPQRGMLCPFHGRGVLGPHLTNVAWAEAYLPTKWHLDPIQPSGHNRHGPKIGVPSCTFVGGELGCHLTQCHLGGGLPPYQLAS